jgi:hypothetical protein
MTIVQNKRLDILLRHVNNVREDCQVLGERLIEKGEEELGRKLIANGLIHDYSKFGGIEWEHLHGDVKDSSPEAFKLAAHQHITTNQHHPECWSGIENMPRLYLGEMVCDLHARSSEFGNDLREWVKDVATKKYGFTPQGRVYKEMKEFIDLLLEPNFK